MSSDEKTDRELLLTILEDLQKIKEKLDIEEKRFITITDYQTEISKYEKFAKDELNLNLGTIKNHIVVLRKFLDSVNGSINEESVKDYFDSIELSSQTNNLKALRRFIRDYLRLGLWVESFEFEKLKAKIKNIPNDEELIEFFSELSHDQSKLLFLILHNSGLRIGEVLQITISNINFETHMIDMVTQMVKHFENGMITILVMAYFW